MDLANSREKLVVSQRSGTNTRVIGFPEKCDFVTVTGFHHSIEAIVRNVGGAALEPLHKTHTDRSISSFLNQLILFMTFFVIQRKIIYI